MKNKIYTVFFILCMMGVMGACDYLDIVPDERPTEEDAFKDKKAAERYLYSCYAFMPKEREGVYLYQTGEVVTDYDRKFLQGDYTAANLGDFHYWSRMYGGIRRCYTLLKNIDAVPKMEENLKTVYKAEAKFLIAYYHFMLLRAYGPIVLVDSELDMYDDTNFPKRSSFDVCVDWIANLYDEAYNSGLVVEHTTTYYGRATQLAAKALKARLLLYAASPLFNGNSEFYSDNLKDPETSEPLMNLTYDPKKWERAEIACQEAVNMADELNYKPFSVKNESEIPSDFYPKDMVEYGIRMSFMDKKNMEVVWADTRKEGKYGPQNQSAPRDPKDDGDSWNGVAPSLATVQNFYTKNGLPISEDPEYYTSGEYYQIGTYEGESTCNLNLDREPRFYAWVSFHNGWYEMQRNGVGRFRTKFRSNDDHGKKGMSTNYSLTGYLIKKWVTPAYDTHNGYTNYPWPIIRVAELYLNLAEAAAEANHLDVAKAALNRVRAHAGIPDVEESWKGIATLDQKKLIEIIRQERTIELSFEGHYGWDIRRWKTADKVLNHNPEGMSVNSATDEEFFNPIEVEMAWKFSSPKNYLLPISDRELNINLRLVQNPGY